MILRGGATTLALLVVAACDGSFGETTSAFAGDVTRFAVDGPTLYMDGDITSDSLRQFTQVMAANPAITTLVECEMPGSVDDDVMIALSRDIRARGLNTHLTSDTVIQSGAVDLFLAGVNRTMEQGAEIGVHGWWDGEFEAADYPRNSPEHDLNRDYIEDMLGSPEFYWFTIEAAPADGMYFMSAEEIAAFGLLTAPVQPPSTRYDCGAAF